MVEEGLPRTFVSIDGFLGDSWTRANVPAVGLRYGIHPKFFMLDIFGGLPKGFRSNFESGGIFLDFASSAQAPVVESDGEDRVFTIGLVRALPKRLANDTSVTVRPLTGEYGEKAATNGEILGDCVGVGLGDCLGDWVGVMMGDCLGDWVGVRPGDCLEDWVSTGD